LVGLRDRAVISVMTFAFARIGAVVAMRVEDYNPKGKRWWVRLHEKGGKRHEMPAHHNLEAYLDSYIEAADIRDGGKAPLFRSAARRTGTLTDKPMHRVDAWRMIQRRAAELGMRARIGCHTEPDRVLDDFGRKAIAGIADFAHRGWYGYRSVTASPPPT
jgi:integrase/recombinase XerD